MYAGAKAPPLVPLFVVGFIACVGLRSTGWIPATAVHAIEAVQTLALAAALFGSAQRSASGPFCAVPVPC
jgi:uncharacterized membrane protein YadS